MINSDNNNSYNNRYNNSYNNSNNNSYYNDKLFLNNIILCNIFKNLTYFLNIFV